ncbi:MAG: flagellar hook-associated protein FlgL [Halopseudomonas sp.]
MRVSSLQIFNNGVRNMQTGQTNLARSQEQISTGKNLNRPSDDPVAAAQILKFKRELVANETFSENISVSQRRLELEELTLQQIKDAGDRLSELAIRGSNGTMNDQNRAGIAAEVEQVQQFILGLMNTKDSQGEYLFAGAKGHTEPFVANAQGGFDYLGDDEARLIQTGSSSYVQSTDSGRDIFQVVPSDVEVDLLNSVLTPLIPPVVAAPVGFGVSVIAATEVGGTSEFEQYVSANGKQDLSLTVTAAVGATPASYLLADSDGNTLSSGAVPLPVAPAMTSVVDMSPPGLSFDLGDSIANLIDGDVVTTTIRPEQPRHSLLTVAQDLITALKTPITDQTSRELLAADMAKAIDEIGAALDGVLETQTQLGGRLVTLQNQESINADLSIFTQAALSNLEDLDYAAAIAKFSFQEVALQAAQQTFSRVNQMSLFNFL